MPVLLEHYRHIFKTDRPATLHVLYNVATFDLPMIKPIKREADMTVKRPLQITDPDSTSLLPNPPNDTRKLQLKLGSNQPSSQLD